MQVIGVAPLVDRAAVGDADAWDELVDRFAGLVWSIARGYGLGPADAADVSQTCWLRLAENVERLHDRARVGSWLATTARRESLAVLKRGRRQVPSGMRFEDEVADEPDLDGSLVRKERAAVLFDAFSDLPALCRTLLRVLLSEPAPSYAEVSEHLDMPVGSIGPRRARCLERLRVTVEQRTSSSSRARLRSVPVPASVATEPASR
jgi:RNA polymerase sigma factor (sigma-70 family)